MSFTLESGKKIFDIINILLANPKSRKEIGYFLKEKDESCAQRSVSKYLKTLKKAGFDIRFEQSFQIVKTPFKAILTEDETKGLVEALLIIENFYKQDEKKINLIKEKLLYVSSQNIDLSKEKLFKSYDRKIEPNLFKNVEILHHYITMQNAKLRVKYENKNLIIIPKKLKYKTNGVFLCAYLPKKDKHLILRVDFINKIKFLNFEKENLFDKNNETVFRLSGKLMKNYILREGEKARYLDKEVVVTNVYENKEELLNRLLKYGNSCEIISSTCDRKKFIKKLKELKKHYKSM